MRRMDLVIADRSYRVAHADTWRRRARGLARTSREMWADCDGMLFTFPFAARWPLWMRGMQFPIRATWLRRGMVVDEHALLLPAHGGRLWRPRVPADQVVELFVWPPHSRKSA